MTKHQRFDRIPGILGFAKGSELASALGSTRKSSSYCHQNDVPESRLGDRTRLARQRGRDPIEMPELVRSPAPAKQPQGRATQNDRRRRQACRALRRDHRALGLGSWLRRCEGRGATIEVPLPDGAAMTDQPFEDAPVAVTLKRQFQCGEREIRRRRQAYPNRIATKRMSAAKAAEEIGPRGAYGLHFWQLLEAAA